MLQGLVPDYVEYCWTESSQLEFILIVPQTILSQKCTVISKKQSQYFPTTFMLYRHMGEGEECGVHAACEWWAWSMFKKCFLWKEKKNNYGCIWTSAFLLPIDYLFYLLGQCCLHSCSYVAPKEQRWVNKWMDATFCNVFASASTATLPAGERL